MASVNSSAADYINKLYDSTQDRQKQMLVDAYSKGTEALDTAQQDVQKQTDSYLERTDVEAQKIDQGYKPQNVSDAVGQQAALTMENQQKKNTQMLRDQQQTADSEIARMRKLWADQFSTAIKQAQAENDMARAQQLYEAAKAKEAELASFSASGGANRIKLIDEIYKKANEAGRLQMESELAGRLSGLYAQQQAQQQETDRNLTQTYVDALKRGQNYNEVQNAYGLGSGNMAQAQLARDAELTQNLTELRRLQMAADAQAGQQIAGTEKTYADEIADLARTNEQKRVAALYQDALTRKQNTTTGAAGGSGGGGGTGAGDGPGAGPEPEAEPDTTGYKLTNQASDTHIRINDPSGTGSVGMKFDELDRWIKAGFVKEVVDHDKKTVTYETVKDPGTTKTTKEVNKAAPKSGTKTEAK